MYLSGVFLMFDLPRGNINIRRLVHSAVFFCNRSHPFSDTQVGGGGPVGGGGGGGRG